MRHGALGLGLGLFLLGVAGCRDDAPVPPVVFTWMECIECDAGELAAVAAMGDSVVPVLRRFLVDGPPPAYVDRMRRGLQVLVGDTAVAGGPVVALQPAVTRQLDDYVRLYRIRAAAGLGEVGGPLARDALCAGLPTPPDTSMVSVAIVAAVARAGSGPCP